LIRALLSIPPKPVDVFGIRFPNVVGLAAGYDKDGLGWRGLSCLGFGHIEVGTVTPRAQFGNPKPRLFRLPEHKALINRMGFPCEGSDFLINQLKKKRPTDVILGVNLGKNKVTPLDKAASDYMTLIEQFSPLADYLAINVSSPNTVGLRNLQAFNALNSLLLQLAEKRLSLQNQLGRSVPILVKLSPDLSDRELDGALDAIIGVGMDGVIATNTTISREGINSSLANESGGLSGAPLRELSTEMISKIYKLTSGELPIIGVGGIMNIDDALEKLDVGASLVQLYTGLIYSGPGLVKDIVLGTKADQSKIARRDHSTHM
jgi:dihydroorotate dehydrogenase